MKDIMLKITGRQIPRDSNPLTKLMTEADRDDAIEFITPGTISTEGNTTYICYDETAISGMEGCKTSLTIKSGKVTMTRSGEKLQETIMEFEKGKRYQGLYSTPYGSVAMELLTNDVSGLMLEDDIQKLSIDYDISLKGFAESRNTLDIEVIDNDNE